VVTLRTSMYGGIKINKINKQPNYEKNNSNTRNYILFWM
jgi:hypothetical protein